MVKFLQTIFCTTVVISSHEPFSRTKSLYDLVKDRHHKNIATEQACSHAHAYIVFSLSNHTYIQYLWLEMISPSWNFTCVQSSMEICLFGPISVWMLTHAQVYLFYFIQYAYTRNLFLLWKLFYLSFCVISYAPSHTYIRAVASFDFPISSILFYFQRRDGRNQLHNHWLFAYFLHFFSKLAKKKSSLIFFL